MDKISALNLKPVDEARFRKLQPQVVAAFKARETTETVVVLVNLDPTKIPFPEISVHILSNLKAAANDSSGGALLPKEFIRIILAAKQLGPKDFYSLLVTSDQEWIVLEHAGDEARPN